MDPRQPTTDRRHLAPTADELGQQLRSPLDRLLLLFSEIRPGEGSAGLSMLASIFCLLVATYLLKPARDGMLASAGIPGLSEMEMKAYSSFAQSLLLLAIVPVYSRLAARLERRRLVATVTAFFISNLVVFWLLQPGFLVERVPLLGVVFYLWFGIFNLLCVVMFWSFAADFYDDEDGTRLFPVIAFGATAGSAAGAWAARKLIRAALFTTYGLLPLAAVALAISVLLMRLADRRDAGMAAAVEPAESASPAWSGRGAFRLVVNHRYLLAIAVVALVSNWVKTNSDNLLFSIVQELMQGEASARGITDPAALDRFLSDQTTAFYAGFFFWVNVGGLVLQALVAARLLKRAGVGWLLLALPVFSIFAYPMLALLPMLTLFRVTKIVEDSTNYSLQNTAMQVLWLPTTREMKYKGKAAVDTFFVRFGDGLAALTTFVGVQLLTLPVKEFFALNAILVVAWLAVSIVVAGEHRGLVARSTSLSAERSGGATSRPQPVLT